MHNSLGRLRQIPRLPYRVFRCLAAKLGVDWGNRRWQDWHAYWADRTGPHHRYNTAEHYAQMARELSILFGTENLSDVLEVGCGDGALYPYLGLEDANYVGVDFSESLLCIFGQTYASLRLVCQDASQYRDGARYDLIFSNGLVQYFSWQMLESFVGNAAAMCKPGGRVVCGNVPWRELRNKYLMGELSADLKRRNLLAGLARVAVASVVGEMQIGGNWYSPNDFRRLAAPNGFDVRFYGSMCYPYRFHAVLSRL